MGTSGKKNIEALFRWLLFLTVAASFILVNFIGPGNVRTRIIDGDGSGYYAYLPALLVFNSVDFEPVFEFEKQRRSKDYQGHYFHREGTVLVNKYTGGTALLLLPFFLLAWLVSLVSGLPPDGYNLLFQYSVALGAASYVYAGLICLKKLTGLYGVKPAVSIPLVLAVLLGTNLFHYAFLAPSMSHVYSFTLITLFFYQVKKTFLQYSRKQVFLAALLLGLIVLVRPVNLVAILAIPFLAGSPQAIKAIFRQKQFGRDVLVAGALFVAALMPQMIINFIQTGHLLVSGYKEEGFYWDRPELVNFLFSYRKGWFVYTPFMLLLIPASLWLYRKSIYGLVTFLVFLAILIYVFSAWWNWLYGDSLGMRPMIDYYALFVAVIAWFAGGIRSKRLRGAVFLFLSLTIVLNLFQTWQYARGILHPDSMNRKAYWYIFMRTGDEYAGIVGDEDEYFYGNLSEPPFLFAEYVAGQDAAIGWSVQLPAKKHEGDIRSVQLDEANVYSPTYVLPVRDSLIGMKHIYVCFFTDYLARAEDAAMGAHFVVDISDSAGNLIFYKTFRMKRLPDRLTGQWREAHIGFKLPLITGEMERMKLYIWNKDGRPLLLSRMSLRFHTYYQ